MIGEGKYGPECHDVMVHTKAVGVILIVMGGDRGSGFSAHLPPDQVMALPAILRDVATQIEKNGPMA